MATLWSAVEVRNAVLAVVVTTVIVYHMIFKFLRAALWEPLRMRRIMTKQGVPGPPFKFLLGYYPDMVKFSESFPEILAMDDLANLSPTVTPQYAMYFPKYGKMFVYWWGTLTKLVVRDPEIVKELVITNHDSVARSELENLIIEQVVGKGLLSQEGDKWNSERRTLNPSFNQEAVKYMVEAMVQGATSEIQTWEKKVAKAHGEVEIYVESSLHTISGRMISRVSFKDDFERGEQVFKLQGLLANEVIKMVQSALFWLIPGYRYLPTKRNRLMNLYNSKADALFNDMINRRQEAMRRKGETSDHNNYDILGRMLAVATDGWNKSAQEFNMASVFNHFKLFFFAGQNTVAGLLMFAMQMLALHPEWQERARAEVLEVLGEEWSWNASAMSCLKVVGMVLNETIRLFPPAISVTRVATKDLQLKRLFKPKGITIECALAAIHQDKDYWGADVGEFNPGRFANGVLEACSHPQAFFPFGLGPRTCLGSNLAAMEARIVLAMVLRRFQLLPSPKYKHHPTCIMVQVPKFGMPIILKAL